MTDQPPPEPDAPPPGPPEEPPAGDSWASPWTSGADQPPPSSPSPSAEPPIWPPATSASPSAAEEVVAPAPEISRRTFLSRASSIAMGTGLVAGYGAFAAMAGRFLYPAHPPLKGWLFVTEAASMKPGASMSYTAPDGATIAIARQGLTGAVGDFIALSSTCPHLGCKVHWEAADQRFFCPCHNGAFDPSGKAIAGPPKEAGQSLGRYPLKIESGLLYIEVPLEPLPGPEPA